MNFVIMFLKFKVGHLITEGIFKEVGVNDVK
jgi:hypothetical protein